MRTIHFLSSTPQLTIATGIYTNSVRDHPSIHLVLQLEGKKDSKSRIPFSAQIYSFFNILLADTHQLCQSEKNAGCT